MNLYLIRHGQTKMNRQGALQGRSDLPLTKEGEAQALKVRDWFAEQGIVIDCVYSSPLGRAVRTGRIVTGGSCPVYVDDRLIEMEYGPYEGTDLKHLPPEVEYFFSDFLHHPAPEGMEQLSDVVARAASFLEELKTGGREGNILISTHAIAMKGALEDLTPDSKGSYWNRYLGNCAVYKTVLEDGVFSVPREILTG